MVPDLPVSMLACARLGVVHSEVFAGFSGTACGGRIADSGSRVLVTIDGLLPRREMLDHKPRRRGRRRGKSRSGDRKGPGVQEEPGEYHSASPMVQGLTISWTTSSATTCASRSAGADAGRGASFLMYTQRHTGRPKGAQLDAGLPVLCGVARPSTSSTSIPRTPTVLRRYRLDTATRTSSTALALGTTSVLYEGAPAYPDPGRPLEDRRALGREHLSTPPPTTVRMLRKLGKTTAKHDYHFKLMCTVGEPIEPRSGAVLRKRRKAEAASSTRVDDRDRGFPGQHPALPQAHEAGQLRPGRPRHLTIIYDDTASVEPAAARPATSAYATRGPG